MSTEEIIAEELTEEQEAELLNLRQELRGMNTAVQQRLDKMVESLRHLQLGVEIDFGGFFRWSKQAGRWDLWKVGVHGHPTNTGGTQMHYRVKFLTWLGQDFGSHLIEAMERAVVEKQRLLGEDYVPEPHLPTTPVRGAQGGVVGPEVVVRRTVAQVKGVVE